MRIRVVRGCRLSTPLHLQLNCKRDNISKTHSDTVSGVKMSVASSDGPYRRKETFVEDMLYHIADSLASDAEFGYNNANQIRDRVEDIAVDMNSNISSSRAVLESRFALGKDNCQYLAQAVAVLWAGDGGERLRVLPPGQMPSILRQASADGVVRAMRGVMSEQIENSRRAVVDAIALVAWMMQTQTIRVAVLEYVTLSDLKEQAAKIQAEYTKGDNNGMDHLIKLAKSAYEQEEKGGAGDHATVQSLLQAVYALTDPSSASQMILGDMLNESQKLVNRTARDSHLVAELQSVIGKMSALTALSKPELTPEAPEEEGSTNHCERKFDAWGRVTKRMDNGTAVTRNQFTVATHAAFNSMRGNSIGDENINDGWNVSRVISPFWNQGSLLETAAKETAWGQIIGDKTNSSDSTLSEEMVSTVRNVYTLGIKSLGGNLLEQRQFLQNNVRDTLHIDYCMIRGNCGFKGPHQTSTNQDSALPYQYPKNPMIGYIEGKYCEAKMDVLANDMHLQIREMMHKHYVEPEERHNVGYDTDPYPRVLSELGSSNGNGSESARKAAWAPVPGKNDEISFDPESSNLCEASMYEFMLRALELQATEVEKDGKDMFKQRRVRCLRAVAASIKIRQLMPMANLKQYNDMNDTTAQKDKRVYVTRPAKHCVPEGSRARPYEMQRVSMPYDSGIALFENGAQGTNPIREATTEESDAMVKVLGSDYSPDQFKEFQNDNSTQIAPIFEPGTFDTFEVDRSAKDVTRWLRQGVESGWKNEDGEKTSTIGVAPANFTLFAEPVRSPLKTGYDDALNSNKEFSTEFDKEVVPDDLYDGNIHNAIVRGMNALGLLRQIDKEHKYIQKLSTEDSAERVGVFGVHGEKTLESATKERRDGVWNDALREVNVSGDRLYRFITILTGAIGESADSAISWEDEDLKQVSKDALARQKALSERVSRFQTKLVESVVSSTLKSSKLQLDMRKSNTNSQELVVLSADTRDSIRQIADGEAGHGFFEAQVEFNDALGKYAKPMSIKDIVSDLQSVSSAFHDQIAASLAPSSGASYARIVEPRNSFMLHLKPDTMAAIQKAYDHISSEMKHCGGYHREIHLWEFVEGKDWTLVTRFAELVGLMLQNTRMRSGSFAAYVGMSQQVANGNNIRMQLQRLRAQACVYLVAQPNAPMWLHKNGRTWYFGGSTSGPNSNGGMRADRAKKRRCRNESQSYEDYGACIGRRKRRLNHPSRDQNMRAYRTMKDSWKQDDTGKQPSGGSQVGDVINSPAVQAAIGNAEQDVLTGLQPVVSKLGVKASAGIFYQIVRRYLSESPGYNCAQVYSDRGKMIQKLLCEALSKKDGEYASPTSGQNQNNPYNRCTANISNSEQPCIPSAVGDFLKLNGEDVKYHAVKVDVFPALHDGDDNPNRTRLDLLQVQQVTNAFNEVFTLADEAKMCDINSQHGWFPHPLWMRKVQSDNEAGIPFHWEPVENIQDQAGSSENYRNVWVKRVLDTDPLEHEAGKIVRNLLNMVETLTAFKKTIVASIVMTSAVISFDGFFASLTEAAILMAKQFYSMAQLAFLLGCDAWDKFHELIMTDAAVKHDNMRKSANTLRKAQETTEQQDNKTLADIDNFRVLLQSGLRVVRDQATNVTGSLLNFTAMRGLARQLPNATNTGNVSKVGGSMPFLKVDRQTCMHFVSFGLAFEHAQSGNVLGGPLFTHLLDTGSDVNIATNGMKFLSHLSYLGGNQQPSLDAIGAAALACGELYSNAPAFAPVDSEAMRRWSENLYPKNSEGIANVPPLQVAFDAIASRSANPEENIVRYHSTTSLLIGGVTADYATPTEGIKALQNVFNNMTFSRETREEMVEIQRNKRYLSNLLARVQYELSTSPTYTMQLANMFNMVHLGTITTALWAWSEESEEGRKRLMAVVRAVQEVTGNIKGSILQVYRRTPRDTDALNLLFAAESRESSEFNDVAKALSGVTGMTEDAIKQDDAFLLEISNIFAEAYGYNGFSKFMEAIMERQVQSVIECQTSGDSVCARGFIDKMDLVSQKLRRIADFPSQPKPSPTRPRPSPLPPLLP